MTKVTIIAEAGVNHNGDVEMAKRLIDVAADAGADYVKFQTFNATKIASATAKKAEYQKTTGSDAMSQLEMLKRLELSEADHLTLKSHSERKGIKFLSTPFDLESIQLLKRLGMRLGKIPSGEVTNLPYLKAMAMSFDELIISSGMADMVELDAALQILYRSGVKKEKITVLHCTTDYPTSFADVNLRSMASIKEKFGVRVGYSDHTPGIDVPIAAVALGAEVIEKHFTLDQSLEGPDHKASLNPDELAQMVKSIRNIEQALGNTDKQPSKSELKNRVIVRKSIFLDQPVKGGDYLVETALTMLRPGDGISPMDLEKIVGRRAARDLEKGHKLSWSDLI
jgi:N-acetylneuraminate synthase